jgi:hypothetical protein
MRLYLRIAASASAAGCIFLAGCGLAAAPQPPSLKLPEPLKDLTGSRAGNRVTLHWTMPKHTTDKVALKGGQRVHICRKLENGPCQTAGDMLAAPDKPAGFTDSLPPQLTAESTNPSAAPKLLTYLVELQNHAGKTAGPSNPVYIAAGPAPLPLTGLHAETHADGVVLRWDKPANASQMQPGLVLRIHRLLVKQPGAPKPSETAETPPPEEQTLEVDLSKGDPGIALDKDAALDHLWRYTAERVRKQRIEKHPIETAGDSDGPVTIDAHDIFPPAIPRDLQAVADEQGKAIDLSWSPNTEPDLAGYVIYRRQLTGGNSVSRHTAAAPAFHDADVEPGIRYAYSISSIDKDGNESAKSPEVQDELPVHSNP